MILNAKNNDSKIEKTADFKAGIITFNEKFDNHKQMLEVMRALNPIENPDNERLQTFKNRFINKVYLMYTNEQSQEKIVNFIEYYLADLYHNRIEKYGIYQLSSLQKTNF